MTEKMLTGTLSLNTTNQPIFTTGWASRFRVMTVSVNLFFNFFLFVCSVELIDFWCVHFIGLKCEFGVFFRVCCFQTCKMKKKKIILVEYWNLLIKKKYQKLYFKIFYLNILVKFLLWSCLPWNLYKQSFKKKTLHQWMKHDSIYMEHCCLSLQGEVTLSVLIEERLKHITLAFIWNEYRWTLY